MSREAHNRRHARVEVPLLVQYRLGALEEPRFDYALNVSQSGLFIATEEDLKIGTQVFVQLTTRDGERPRNCKLPSSGPNRLSSLSVLVRREWPYTELYASSYTPPPGLPWLV